MIHKRYEQKIKQMKGDPLFDKEIDDIIKTRFFNGKDKARPAGRRIIQRKIIRHAFWPNIKQDLKIADFVKEDDAFMTAFNWFNIMIVAFVAILVFAGLIYAMGLINGVMHGVGISNDIQVGTNSCFAIIDANTCSNTATCSWNGNSCVPVGYVNMTTASDATFGQANLAIQNLRVVAIALIFSLILATVLINFAVKVHPMWFFVYLMIVVLAIIMAAPISNSYMNLLNSNIFGGILPSFTGANWIMINLPMIVAIGGLLGGIFLFINIIRGTGEVNRGNADGSLV